MTTTTSNPTTWIHFILACAVPDPEMPDGICGSFIESDPCPLTERKRLMPEPLTAAEIEERAAELVEAERAHIRHKRRAARARTVLAALARKLGGGRA